MKIFKPMNLYYAVVFAALIAMCSAIVSCSPQKRLDSLLSRHPELMKADTVFKEVPVITEPINVTQAFKYNPSSIDSFGLALIMERYHKSLDSLKNTNTSPEQTRDFSASTIAGMRNFIVNRKCLEDTLIINLQYGGFARVWQHGAYFYCTVQVPKQVKLIRMPTVTNTASCVNKYYWSMFFGGFFLAVLLLSTIGVCFFNFRK